MKGSYSGLTYETIMNRKVRKKRWNKKLEKSKIRSTKPSPHHTRVPDNSQFDDGVDELVGYEILSKIV
jgi:hypothetical protein